MTDPLDELIERALGEDIGDGDHTSLACIPENAISKAQLLVKEAGVLAGVDVARRIFNRVDSGLQLEAFLRDGQRVEPGDVAFIIKGSARSILSAERLVLNCMQRMSGIATYTAHLCALIEGTGVKLLDTRKTSPGMRVIEKMAVKLGGGENHRIGLYDMMMIKDNHIDFAGGVKQAIENALQYQQKTGKQLKIEVEARSLAEMEEILSIGKIDRIMLDNFSFDDMRTAVARIDNQFETEASGGITEKTIRQYAECGVDYISVGALTHSVKSLDLSLNAIEKTH
jgi:nicotinate-nucleotide pyrophosphorylase (carboxylating)